MHSQIGPRCRLTLGKAVAVSIVLGVHLALAWSAGAALESGLYQTVPGATVEERGDRVPNDIRIMPLAASLSFDLSAAPPSLTAVMHNAVLEGGDPFALTVRSSSGAQLVDGTYRFSGDYLQDLYPSGTQYLFDWEFSTSTNGQVVWHGINGWAGGHIWQVTITNITIVPDTTRPSLGITQAGSHVTVSWLATYPGYALEQAASLPATDWTTVTNAAAITADQFSVAIEPGAAQGFFRLRKN